MWSWRSTASAERAGRWFSTADRCEGARGELRLTSHDGRTPSLSVRLAARRCQPSGGSVLVFDFDSDQTVVDAPDPALTRRIAEVLDAAVPHPWIGRQLFGLFRRVGLRDVRVVPHVICLPGAAGFAIYQQLNQGTIDRARQADQVTAEEVAAWWASLERAGETEMFFTAVLGFIAVGNKP